MLDYVRHGDTVIVANWEKGTSKASSSNLEKLSMYYGIGPEYFYEKDVEYIQKQMIIDSSNKAKLIEKESEGRNKKSEMFKNMMSSTSFSDALSQYMFCMKLLLATADSGDLEKLKTASLINKKMGDRLDEIINLREKEEISKGPTLFQLLDTISD